MNTFIKHHCLINRKDKKPRLCMNDVNLKIEQREMNTAYFDYLLDRVGTPWKWTCRPKYKEQRDPLVTRLYDENTRLLTFKKGEKLIGYTLITLPEESIAQSYKKIIEIENFGLFPEYTAKGYGNYLLQAIFETLFKEYDWVYLTTRSTNHKKVVPFYQKNGMRVIKSEVMDDDLLLDFPTQESIAA